MKDDWLKKKKDSQLNKRKNLATTQNSNLTPFETRSLTIEERAKLYVDNFIHFPSYSAFRRYMGYQRKESPLFSTVGLERALFSTLVSERFSSVCSRDRDSPKSFNEVHSVYLEVD